MELRTIGIAIIAAVLVYTVAREVAKRLVSNRLDQLFGRGDFQACLRLIDGPVAAFGLPRFNRNFAKLNAHELMGDDEATAALIDQMLKTRCAPNQRLALLARAFDFYADQPNKEKAAHLLDLIESNGDKELLRESRRKYAIVFEKRWSYIKEMERALPKATGEERARLCYLLAIQYENKGDKHRAKEYLEKSVE